MKVVILAGGMGTRLAEETDVRPKPMVEIGGYPILLHIMRHYAYYSFQEFFVALGYKGEDIKRYFLDYHAISAKELSFTLKNGHVNFGRSEAENWHVTLVDTGYMTQTGGRIKRLEKWLYKDTFLLTYGDGVSNVDLNKLVDFHRHHGRIATVTAVRPPARFGGLTLDGDTVVRFTEKPQIGEGWINGGFFVFEPTIFEYLEGDESILEADTLEQLAAEGELIAYRHTDFWQCMDTLRDKRYLEHLWQQRNAPWRFDS